MENQQKKESDISKKYNGIVAELGKLGEFNQVVELEKNKKVSNDVVTAVIAELVEEAKQKNREEVKAQVKDLALKKAALDKEIRELTRQFENAVEAKKKEFTDKANAVMANIQRQQQDTIERVNDLSANNPE